MKDKVKKFIEKNPILYPLISKTIFIIMIWVMLIVIAEIFGRGVGRGIADTLRRNEKIVIFQMYDETE